MGLMECYINTIVVFPYYIQEYFFSDIFVSFDVYLAKKQE